MRAMTMLDEGAERIGAALRRLRAAMARAQRARRRSGWTFPFSLRRPATRLLLLLLVVLGALAGALAWGLSYMNPVSPGTQIPLTQLLALSKSGNVATAVLYDVDHRVAGELTINPAAPTAPSGHLVQYWTTLPSSDVETPLLIDRLSSGGTVVDVHHQADKAIVQFISQYILPIALLANLFGIIFLLARGGGGDSMAGVVEFGRLSRRRQKGKGQRITFADIGGADEALLELREVRDYLADPVRFTTLGAQPPKGVLLVGPPGCGKTLMARAVAGESDVPFFSISGAEFVESLVGVGAARVRDLFRQVRRAAPAIVFIDELDAAGRRRGGVSGGQEEREQTLNQLLVEMDGFEPAEGIVVMGATNRPDILDPALLRPGRFDRQVTVEPPDIDGRRAILELHSSRRPVADDVDLQTIARRTPGFTGADLANVVNEAALLAVRFGKVSIGAEEFEEAVQRVLTGPRRKGHLLSSDERRRAAYHESGHAVVAAAMGRLDGVQRLSIIARGRSLGEAALSRGLQERALLSRTELRSELVCAMGGIAAEELVLGEPSTGSQSDLERANSLAEMIVGCYGMSERLGKVLFVRMEGSEFLGSQAVPRDLSAGPVMMELHQEVRRMLDEAESTAMEILTRHRAVLTRLARQLTEKESLDTPELEVILEPVRPEMNLSAIDAVEPVSMNGNRTPHHVGAE